MTQDDFATPEVGSDEWHAIRRTGIGGSDAAAVLNLSPWANPLDVYLDKVGEAEKLEETDPMHWGILLEPVIATETAVVMSERLGRPVKLQNRQRTYRSKVHPWMLANLDRIVVESDALVEIKAVGFHSGRKDYGIEETDEVPAQYIAQVQHQLAVTGRSEGWLSVLIGGQDHRLYYIARDERFIDAMTQLEHKFWTEHVVPQVPPEIDDKWDADGVADTLARLYGKPDNDEMLEPEDWQPVMKAITDLRSLTVTMKADANVRTGYQNRIKEYIGDAGGLESPVGKITWKKSKDGEEEPDYKQAFGMLAQQCLVEEFLPQGKLDEIRDAVMVPGRKGSRRFIVPRRWSEAEENDDDDE